MKMRQLTFPFVLAVIACSIGYLGRGLQDYMGARQSVRTRDLEPLRSPNSFSEIQTAKAELQALSTRFITEFRTKHRVPAPTPVTGPQDQTPNPEKDSRFAEALGELKQGIEEFKGTDQELRLVQELLWLLKKERLFSDWLNVYLGALYQHPTHQLISQFADEAVLMGHATGREREVLAGFRHLTRDPLATNLKGQVQAAANDVRNSSQADDLNHCSHL